MKKILLMAIALFFCSCNSRNSEKNTVVKSQNLNEYVIGDWISTAFAYENDVAMIEIAVEDAVKISFEAENISKMTLKRNTEYYNYSISGKKITLKGEDDKIKFLIFVDSIKDEMLYTHMGIPSKGYNRMIFEKNN